LKGDYLQNRIVFSGFSEKELLSLAHSLSQLCKQRDIRHAFTLASGLESNERNVREQLMAAYISVSPERLRDDNTDAGGVFYQPRTLTNGLTGVNPVQLYLDFTLHGWDLGLSCQLSSRYGLNVEIIQYLAVITKPPHPLPEKRPTTSKVVGNPR